MSKHIAIYTRVSTRAQDQRSQIPDLDRWKQAYADGAPVVWYQDVASGKSMDRPGWRKLEAALRAGKASKIVVWRLDRLGRTVSGLTALFDELHKLKIGLVSIKDSIDLETAAGRLMGNVLASVAAYENEVRSERIVAGQAVARANGQTWGGSRRGRRLKVTPEQEKTVQRLRREGETITAIASATGLSRPTIYRLLSNE